MVRYPVAGLAVVLLLTAASGLAMAQQAPGFKLGFGLLASQIPDVAGQPVEEEWHNPENGDGLQRTTTGLMVWRKADNWTAFTDGTTTWINGPFGLQSRPNSSRLPWETDAPVPTLVSAPPPQVPPAATSSLTPVPALASTPVPTPATRSVFAPTPVSQAGAASSPPVGPVAAVHSGESAGVVIGVTGYMRQQVVGERVRAADGYVYVLVTATIENSRASRLPYVTFDFQLRDDDDRVYPARNLAFALPGSLGSGMVDPGDEVSGHLAFEIPTTSTGHRLAYDPVGVIGFSPIIVDLR